MRWASLSLSAALALAGCPAAHVATPRTVPAAAPFAPLAGPSADGRLPAYAVPLGYAIELDVDPAKPRFHGEVRIELEIPRATPFVVLHGHALDVKSARVLGAPGREAASASVSARTAQGGTSPEELVLGFAKPLPPGRATLVIDYEAAFDDSLAGLYRVHDGGRPYAYTQFEPTDARRAFPCFDEPSFKVPFDVTVTVPKGMLALANAPESSREERGDRTRFRFARTQPLPTYLVALAVGDFEIAEVTRYTRPPVRIVTTKGKTATGALALEATSGIVDALAEWFAIPYPYDKLDIVAVPEFRSGAMENPGLVTFREERLLLDPTRASQKARRSQALIIAHELAHQWFGDLVTASWWNDLWLNEGMATWMEARIVDTWRPSFGARTDAVVATHAVMDVDGLAAARAVRQPVVSSGDAQEAFDGITYQKGAALLSTIERWVGAEPFQRGVRTYLRENAFASVQADRLLSALDRATGKDVTQLASAYLDKPGVPEVTARLECEPRSRWHVELSSQAWRPLGSTLPEQGDQSWVIPVCLGLQGEKTEACTDLVAGAPALVAGKGRCPTFVHPNPNATYYRFSLPEPDLVRLADNRQKLEASARVSLLSNAWASVRSGQLEPKALLKVLPAFDADDTRQVVEQLVDILGAMSIPLVDDDARSAFRTFSLARLGKRKQALGFTASAKGNASPDDPLSRAKVLLAMGDVAEDDATLREADELARKWLGDPASVDADIAEVAVTLGSRRADEARVDALRAAVKGAKSREDRIIALRALGGFDAMPAFEKALASVFDEEIKANEVRYVLGPAFARRKSRPLAEAWVRAHWSELRKRLPGRLSVVLVQAASVGCSRAELEERTAFYGPEVASIEGSRRELAGALEAITLCAALREHGATPFRKALLGTKK